jgi:hypothetical protein
MIEYINEAEERDQEHRHKNNEVQDNTSLVTLTPWLRRTRWHERYNGKDMKLLYELTSSPKCDDPSEMVLWDSVDRMVRKCWSGFHDCSTRGWELIPFWLVSAVRGKEDTKPFRTYIAPYTLCRYIGYWQRYILFCLRSIDELAFTTRQMQLMKEIQELIEHNSYNSENELDDVLLELSASLICHSDYSHVQSSLIYFSGVMGYNVDYKQWRGPHDYTTILAGLQFCIRIIMLEHTLPTGERERFNEVSSMNPVEEFCKMRERWLVDGEGTTSSALINDRDTVWIHSSVAQLWLVIK